MNHCVLDQNVQLNTQYTINNVDNNTGHDHPEGTLSKVSLRLHDTYLNIR